MYPANVGMIAIINIPCRNHVDEIFDRHLIVSVCLPGFIVIEAQSRSRVRSKSRKVVSAMWNRGMEIRSHDESSKARTQLAHRDVGVFFAFFFLILIQFYQDTYTSLSFGRKFYLSKAHSSRGMRATSKELRDR